MSIFSENIRLLRRHIGLNQNEFAEYVTATRGQIESYEGARAYPKAKLADEIAKKFGISIKELMEEELNPKKYPPNSKKISNENRSNVTPKYEAIKTPSDNFMEVPILSIYAQAGYLRGEADISTEAHMDKMLVPKEYEKGHYLVVELQGDSMNDGTDRALKERDKFLVKELSKDMWSYKLQYRLWVIVHKDGVVFKEIINHDLKKNTITCHSWNPDPIFKDYELHLAEVYRLFYVKKMVERQIVF